MLTFGVPRTEMPFRKRAQDAFFYYFCRFSWYAENLFTYLKLTYFFGLNQIQELKGKRL